MGGQSVDGSAYAAVRRAAITLEMLVNGWDLSELDEAEQEVVFNLQSMLESFIYGDLSQSG